MDYLTTRFATHCTICQKEIEVKCGWYNQVIGEWWMYYKDSWHKLVHHRKNFTISNLKYFIKLHLVFGPIVVLQINDIFVYLIRQL